MDVWERLHWTVAYLWASLWRWFSAERRLRVTLHPLVTGFLAGQLSAPIASRSAAAGGGRA